MKECFGKFKSSIKLALECNKCDEAARCDQYKNSEGACNCPYKLSCHRPRQHIQNEYLKNIEECFFYKALKPMYEAKGLKTWPENMEGIKCVKQKETTLHNIPEETEGEMG